MTEQQYAPPRIQKPQIQCIHKTDTSKVIKDKNFHLETIWSNKKLDLPLHLKQQKKGQNIFNNSFQRLDISSGQ